MRLLSLLLVALALPATAHADALGDLEREVDGHCRALARPDVGDPAPPQCAPRGVGMAVPGHDTTLLFGRFQGRWHVDWHDTFVRARRELAGGNPMGRRRLDEAARYAVRRGDAPRVFEHGQRGASCREGVPCGGPGHLSRERWVSGLSHATALRAWLLAYEQGGAERDLGMVRDLVAVFELPVERGGVATDGVAGTHYAEYSYQRRQLIFNGFATAVDALAEAGQATALPDEEREAAWGLYTVGIAELEAEHAIAGACSPLAYDLLLLPGGRAVGDRREDKAHADTSAEALGRLARRLAAAPPRDDFSSVRARLFALRAQRTIIARRPLLPKRTGLKCRPGFTPPQATRIGIDDRELVAPARLPLSPEGMTGFARDLRWTRWGTPQAEATGTAHLCRLGRCGTSRVTIRADRRLYWPCSPGRWYYRRVVATLPDSGDFRIQVPNVRSCH